MKKLLSGLVVLVVIIVSVVPVFAEEEIVVVRRSILINGAHQRYIPLPFQIPSVSCGVLEVKEYKQSFKYFGQEAQWETKFPGEQAGSGWYRFEVTGADMATCAPVIDIVSTVPQWQANNVSGGFLEVEPEDLGLLIRNGFESKNVFMLSEDDSKFSYELVSNGTGTERELSSFVNDTHFFSDTGKGIVGAIISDDRGFLVKKVAFKFKREQWRAMVNPRDNIIVHEGEVIVLIRREI